MNPRLISIPAFEAENGTLWVFDEVGLGIPVQRVFAVQGAPGAVRGLHAHKKCRQVLVALSGRISVKGDSASGQFTHELNSPYEGLVLEPMTWSSQTFQDPDSLLLVACDRPYEESGYISDYQTFLQMINLRRT